MTRLTDEEILGVATQHCAFTGEGYYHLNKYTGWAIVQVVRECFELAELCRQAEAAGTVGVTPAPVPRYAVRWSTGGYLAYEKDGGRTLTPDELEKALNANGVAEAPAPGDLPPVHIDRERMERALAGPRFVLPTGLTQEQTAAFITATANAYEAGLKQGAPGVEEAPHQSVCTDTPSTSRS